MPLNIAFFASNVQGFWTIFKYLLKTLTRPFTEKSSNAIFDLTRSRRALLLENAFLRQQLAILQRQMERPKITRRDRLKLLLLARFLPNWKSLLQIVQPATLLRWHRDLFKTFWEKKSGPKTHPRRISDELIALIRQMAEENKLWGAERIRGELLKLGMRVAKRTIQKYLPKDRWKRGPAWATFLQNHAQDIFVCDFTVVHDLFFRPIYVFVVMHLATRQIVHTNVSRNPTGSWTAQQMREISPWSAGPRFLICDNDAIFGKAFEEAAAGVGTEIIHTPLYTPQANGHCERLIKSLKSECPDHMLIFHEKQLRRTVKAYTVYYNSQRPHQGLAQQVPMHLREPGRVTGRKEGERLVVTPFLYGLHHSYSWDSPPH